MPLYVPDVGKFSKKKFKLFGPMVNCGEKHPVVLQNFVLVKQQVRERPGIFIEIYHRLAKVLWFSETCQMNWALSVNLSFWACGTYIMHQHLYEYKTAIVSCAIPFLAWSHLLTIEIVSLVILQGRFCTNLVASRSGVF